MLSPERAGGDQLGGLLGVRADAVQADAEAHHAEAGLGKAGGPG